MPTESIVVQFPLPGKKDAVGFRFAVKPEAQTLDLLMGPALADWQRQIGGVLHGILDKVFDATGQDGAIRKLTDAIQKLNTTSPFQIADVGDVPAVQIDDTLGNRLEISFDADVAAPRASFAMPVRVHKTGESKLLVAFNEQSHKLDAREIYVPADVGEVEYGGIFPATHERFDFRGKPTLKKIGFLSRILN